MQPTQVFLNSGSSSGGDLHAECWLIKSSIVRMLWFYRDVLGKVERENGNLV